MLFSSRTSIVRRLIDKYAYHRASCCIQQQPHRTIVHKSLLKLDPETTPPPWPYKEKSYTKYHFGLDWTTKRQNENSRLIIVEGNIGSGKSTLARDLADQLGFYHMHEFRMDDILIDRYGNDMRHFYHLFPKCYRIPDIDMFYANPHDDLSARMQDRIYFCRYEQYLNALAHILNTGQGVVLERSVHSDFVFVNAMRAKNFIGKEFFRYYYYMRKLTLHETHFWPHLVIYLDTPVHKCLENIRRRGKSSEIDVIDEEYLTIMAESYKDALKEYKLHSKVMVFDWTQPGTTDRVIEDIEREDFDFFEWHTNSVFAEWHDLQEYEWNTWRRAVTEKEHLLHLPFMDVPKNEVGELFIHPHDMVHMNHVMIKFVLKSRYGHGYNPSKGDGFLPGFWVTRKAHQLPEPWIDYYYKEAWYENNNNPLGFAEHRESDYDPDYLHHTGQAVHIDHH